MELRFAKSFEVEYASVTKGNKPLQRRVRKQLILLQQNPTYPSLRLHKLGNRRFWSISVDKSIRILLLFEKEWI